MKSRFSILLTLIALGAAVASPVRADERVIPPAITKVWPMGMQRGTTVTFNLDGRNLSDIKAVIFDSPGITAKGDADCRHVGKEKPVMRPARRYQRPGTARQKANRHP